MFGKNSDLEFIEFGYVDFEYRKDERIAYINLNFTYLKTLDLAFNVTKRTPEGFVSRIAYILLKAKSYFFLNYINKYIISTKGMYIPIIEKENFLKFYNEVCKFLKIANKLKFLKSEYLKDTIKDLEEMKTNLELIKHFYNKIVERNEYEILCKNKIIFIDLKRQDKEEIETFLKNLEIVEIFSIKSSTNIVNYGGFVKVFFMLDDQTFLNIKDHEFITGNGESIIFAE